MKKDYLNYNLFNLEDTYLENNNYKIINSTKKGYNNTIKDDLIFNYNSPPVQPLTQSSGINWGRQAPIASENAYVQPTPEEVQRVLEAVHMIKDLPEDEQRRLVEATREVRYFFDGQIRATFGGTRHFNAIRCLNDPTRTEIASSLRLRNTQLAGEEFFALNRFMLNYPDISDIQWWAVYQNGSWTLDTWNPEGEHLDTGFDGWGNLVGSVMKINGRVLTPTEMIAFYRTVRLRNERQFIRSETQQNLKDFLAAVDSQGSLPSRYDQQVETAIDLGLVGEDGRTLTYTGRSMILPVTARQRKQRQLTETNPEIRRIIVPTILN